MRGRRGPAEAGRRENNTLATDCHCGGALVMDDVFVAVVVIRSVVDVDSTLRAVVE